ncbi:MAG TPA: SWIM zinc finger family protein, partial [Thermoanaerobaculia bacterium]
MRAEANLRKILPRRIVGLGDAYYLQGRVIDIDLTEDGLIEAHVRGERVYRVLLEIDGDGIDLSCTCPWFQRQGEECKHIWAAIRAAGSSGLLPERELHPVITYDAETWDPPRLQSVARIREAPPPWKRFLDAVGPEPPVHSKPPQAVPEEFAYVIAQASPHVRPLVLNLFGRSHKKNGEWGGWRRVQLSEANLPLLPQFDRETIGLLSTRQWGMRIEQTVSVSPAMTPWWMERLARAGQLYIEQRDGVLLPIGWDEGPAWSFRAAITSDSAESKYRIAGEIRRGDETLPLSEVDAIFPGAIVTKGRASPFEAAGNASWLNALTASGPVEVPHADAERFREALLKAPARDISIPEELGWTIIDERPLPVLKLQQQPWTAELIGDLEFLYGEWLVPSRSTELQKTSGRSLIRRHPQLEGSFRSRLAGLAMSTREGYRFRAAQFEDAARKLIAEGWTLRIDAHPVHVAADLDVNLSSGIDWFDLNVTATFGDVSVALPELLAAEETNRSMMRLPDGSYGIVPSSWKESLGPVFDLGRREGNGVRFRLPQALLIESLLQSTRHKSDVAFGDLCRRVAHAAPEPRNEPPTLMTVLRPYQRAGLG